MYELFCVLQLTEHVVEATECHNQMERVRAMEKLNEVKVRCTKKQTWVKIIINILISLGLPHRIIIIDEASAHPL
jgi:hypothetical protein